MAALSLMLVLAAAAAPAGQKRKVTASPDSPKNNDSTLAQRTFATRCAGCHGLDGKGAERAPDIVTRPAVRQLSDLQLLSVLQKGVPQTSMPAFSYLGDDALRSLVVHLRTLQGNRVAVSLPGDAKRGREIFFGKGECSQCHMIRGEGGFFGSDLTHYAAGRAPEAIHDAIVYPNRDLAPRLRTVVATLVNGRSFQGLTLNEDNFSMQLLTPDGVLHLLSKDSVASLTYKNESPMPADYATRLSKAELDHLANFLYSLAENESKAKQGRDQFHDE